MSVFTYITLSPGRREESRGARRPGQTPALRKVARAFKSASQVAGARARGAGEALTRAVRWRQGLCHISDGQEEVLRCDH